MHKVAQLLAGFQPPGGGLPLATWVQIGHGHIGNPVVENAEFDLFNTPTIHLWDI
jgi:hypothetical protein